MSQISRQQYDELLAAVQAHDFLRRMVEALEQYFRLVFHNSDNIEWDQLRHSAQQVLMAEILTRHRGNPQGIYFALRDVEDSGTPWNVAINELAGRIHSYFTTPLGIVMRKAFFGEQAAFILPEAEDWARIQQGAPPTRPTEQA